MSKPNCQTFTRMKPPSTHLGKKPGFQANGPMAWDLD